MIKSGTWCCCPSPPATTTSTSKRWNVSRRTYRPRVRARGLVGPDRVRCRRPGDVQPVRAVPGGRRRGRHPGRPRRRRRRRRRPLRLHRRAGLPPPPRPQRHDVTQHLFAVASGSTRWSSASGRSPGRSAGPSTIARRDDHHPGLERLFQSASRASKRVESRTGLGADGRSVVGVGLDLAERTSPVAPDLRVIVGTGAYAGASLAALARGCADIAVYSASGRAARSRRPAASTPRGGPRRRGVRGRPRRLVQRGRGCRARGRRARRRAAGIVVPADRRGPRAAARRGPRRPVAARRPAGQPAHRRRARPAEHAAVRAAHEVVTPRPRPTRPTVGCGTGTRPWSRSAPACSAASRPA